MIVFLIKEFIAKRIATSQLYYDDLFYIFQSSTNIKKLIFSFEKCAEKVEFN